MTQSITGTGIGAPDFVKELRLIIYPIASNSALHFTDALVQNAIERENITGLRSNRIRIDKVTIQSVQSLYYQILLYATDQFEESSLDDDKFVGAIDLNLPLYGVQQTTSQYRMSIESKIDYVDLDGTKEIHAVLKNLSPTAKITGSLGEVKIEFLCESRA